MQVYLGIDVGSVSTNVVVLKNFGELVEKFYLRTNGQPIKTVQKGLSMVRERLGSSCQISGVGTTGSARRLAGVIVGADTVKNEITAHAAAALREVPGARTIIEIGGQDSKIIVLREGTVADFAMNTVCAAGTGSFLDQQASRLDLSIEQFSRMALEAKTPVRIAGRCSVFAESDMIHKQQMGHNLEDIIAGLCQALVRNYLNNVGKGKDIHSPVVFQGGVAANDGMRRAFQEALGSEIIVPKHFNVMGAIGAALFAMQEVDRGEKESSFRGFETAGLDFSVRSFECSACANMCEVVELVGGQLPMARWGDRCGKWSEVGLEEERDLVRTKTG